LANSSNNNNNLNKLMVKLCQLTGNLNLDILMVISIQEIGKMVKNVVSVK